MTISIDGKEYDEKKFSPELQNYIVSRQELQASRTRLNLEIEKFIDIKKSTELVWERKIKEDEEEDVNTEGTPY